MGGGCLILEEAGPFLPLVFQGGVRFNTFVAIAIAEALFGKKGLLDSGNGCGLYDSSDQCALCLSISLTVPSDKVALRGFP